MTTFAHVVAGQVTDTGPLPEVWRWPDGTTTSGFPCLEPGDHQAAGWLPLIDQRPELGPGQTYGPDEYTVDVDAVTVTAAVVSPPLPTTPGLRTGDLRTTPLRS